MSRNRRCGSIKLELLKKSREAAIAAVQIFNNPNIYFKSELFIVTILISWTYLLHAYFRNKNIEYRYVSKKGTRKKIIQQKEALINFGNWSVV
jgi:predicted adenine nucleotide alpha hydrolase (AANH) superfamily ATPase